MSSGSYYEEEMSSGGHRRLTAFILWPFPLSKKSPLDPPSPWSWLGAYTYGYMGKGNYASNIRKIGKSCKSSLTKPNMEGQVWYLV